MKKIKIVSLLIFPVVAILFIGSFLTDVQGQSNSVVLFLMSEKTDYQVGDIIEAEIRLNTGGQKAVTTKAKVSYDTSKLSVIDVRLSVAGTQISVAGSRFEEVVNNTVDTTTGLIELGGLRLAPYLSGSNLLLGTINFRVIAAGQAVVAVESSSFVVRPTDGQNILTDAQQSSFTLTEATGQTASLSINPIAGSYEIGQTFETSIIINTGGQSSDTATLTISYDPLLLEVEDADSSISGIQISAGSLYSDTDVNSVNVQDGQIEFSQAMQEGESYIGQGVLANISFKTLAKGIAEVTLQASVENEGINILDSIVDGQYEITEPEDENPLSDLPYPNGSLLKGTSEKIYLIENDQKKWIVSPDSFVDPSSYNDIINVSDDILSMYPNGSNIEPEPAPSVTLMRAIGDNKVYIIEDGFKRHIVSVQMFDSFNYSWSDIQDVTETELDQYPRVKHIKLQNDEKVYYITETGLKRHIPTAAIFNSYGNNWQDIKIIGQVELNAYPVNELIRAEGDSKVYRLQSGQKRWISSATSFEQYGFSWSKISTINRTELNHYPEGTPLD